MLSFFFSHSLFLLSHPFPPLFPPPQSTTRRNQINASQAKNQSLLLNIIPSYVASYYLRKGANSQVCMYAHMYVHVQLASAGYFTLCRVTCTCPYFDQLYVHLTTLPPSYPPINCTLPNSLSPSQPPSLSPTHPSLSSLA